MLIDTNDQQQMQRYEKQKEWLIEEKLEKGEYTSSDIALVRVTDHLPLNGFISSIADVPFVYKMNNVAHEAVDRILEEQGLSWDERKDQARALTPLSTQYRSSVHFCLNGIVSSHMQGNFEGNPFVIIEPFSEHENDDNILAVRGEDTYFKGGLELSDKFIILVDKRYASQLIDSGIDESKVVFYKGDQAKALESMLIHIGIVPELVWKDYIIDSKTSPFIDNFIKGKQYPHDKHCFSESYVSDDEKTLVLWQKYGENFYSYLYSKVYGDTSSKKEEIDMLSKASGYDQKAVDTVVSLIKTIGMDNYKNIIDDYNATIIDKISKGEYPTNNQILAGVPLEIGNTHVK